MRFLAGALLGSVLSTAGGLFVVNTWFRPGVETYPEFKAVAAENVQVKQELGAARREVELLKALAHFHRNEPQQTYPNGVIVPAADRIPAPAVPYPTVPCEPGKRRD